MFSLFVFGALACWTAFVIWIVKKSFAILEGILKLDLTTGFFPFLFQIAFGGILFILPVADQIIAYPQWKQLCAHTGDFEFGPGMDEKKVYGRKVYVSITSHRKEIFPKIKVVFDAAKWIDSLTNEVVFEKPHFHYMAYAFLYLPSSSGDKNAPFLSGCSSGLSQQEVDQLNVKRLTINRRAVE